MMINPFCPFDLMRLESNPPVQHHNHHNKVQGDGLVAESTFAHMLAMTGNTLWSWLIDHHQLTSSPPTRFKLLYRKQKPLASSRRNKEVHGLFWMAPRSANNKHLLAGPHHQSTCTQVFDVCLGSSHFSLGPPPPLHQLRLLLAGC